MLIREQQTGAVMPRAAGTMRLLFCYLNATFGRAA